MLVPPGETGDLQTRFSRAAETLNSRGKTAGCTTRLEHHPRPDSGVVAELHHVYRAEHDGRDPGDLGVYRCVVHADRVNGSVNELAMVLSHLLTPVADLPRDVVCLERETDFELPARYPWTVSVRP